MYDPLHPNDYKDWKWKRLREAAASVPLGDEAGPKDRRTEGSSSTNSGVEPRSSAAHTTDSSLRDLLLTEQRGGSGYGTALSGRGVNATQEVDAPLSLDVSAEELYQQRVRRSAALGIQVAQQLEREELELQHKTKLHEESDRKSKVGKLMGKLMAATQQQPAIAAEAGATLCPDSSSSVAPTSASQPSSQLQVDPAAVKLAPGGHLEFRPSPLAAGGHVVQRVMPHAPLPGAGRAAKQTAPSSTLLFKNIRLQSTDTEPEHGNGSSQLPATLQEAAFALQEACSREGVVRAVQTYQLSEEDRQRLSARINADAAALQPHHREPEGVVLAREQNRVLVRMDTVASAFKALEAIQRTINEAKGAASPSWGSVVFVCFFPTARFEARNCGPSDNEPLVPPPG